MPEPDAVRRLPLHLPPARAYHRGMRVSVIMPVLNESAAIAACLEPLQHARRAGHEVILVDGGSTDDTREQAAPLVDRVLEGPRGRAVQMNHGAHAASGDVLWFLHADTLAPEDAVDRIVDACHGGRRTWGRFDVTLDAPGVAFRVIETSINLRSRFSGIATGDQGMFVSRRLFDAVGGFPELPLMEDVAMSHALRQRGLPVALSTRLRTSARRWQDNGTWRTVWLMWRLRLAFFLGADPADLHRRYYGPSA